MNQQKENWDMRRNKAGQIYLLRKKEKRFFKMYTEIFNKRQNCIFVRIIKHINETNKFDSNTFKLGHF